MELDLTEEQRLLRDSTVRFIKHRWPVAAVREIADAEEALPSSYLRAAGDLGWFAPLIPEEYGGGSVSGHAVRELAIIAEERGRGLQPGPFMSMNVAAAAIARGGSPEQKSEVLPRLVSGESVATWAGNVLDGSLASDNCVAALPSGDGFVLSGRAGLVEYGAEADFLLVTARLGYGLGQFLVPATTKGISVLPLEALDVTRRFSAVHFQGVEVVGATKLGAPDWPHGAERAFQLGLVLTVAETVGAMDALFEMTRQYALHRIAFGRPIGSFQAVKHQMADISLGLEAAKAVSAVATAAVQEDQHDAGEIASIAKAWLADVGIDLAQGCFQVFGGIGYTWDHDCHLFLRRITLNSTLLGNADVHRERICTLNTLWDRQ